MYIHKRLIVIVFVIVECCQLINCQTEGIKPAPGIYQLNCEDVTMLINGNIGGRIVSLKIDNIEMLGTNHLHRAMYGSTLWLSPEGKWRGQGILDNGAYELEKSTRSYFKLKSLKDTVRGFAFTKEFRTTRKKNSFSIKYTITNIARNSQEVAPWEVTRVPAGGLAISPKGSPQNNPIANKIYPLLTVTEIDNIIWYPFDSSKVSAQKLFMDGGEGWIAYIKDRMLFIKQFPVISALIAAPNEKNIEMYVNKEKTYIELENQGEYQNLMPGESLSYEVKWYACKLPADLNLEMGDDAIIKFIKKIIII